MSALRHLRAALRLWRVRRDLARLGFDPALRRWLGPIREGAADPAEWARCVRRIGARWPGSKCLDQSVALASLLRERGIDAILLIGADRQGGQVMSHAWVEVAGYALAEPASLGRFQVLKRWPEHGS